MRLKDRTHDRVKRRAAYQDYAGMRGVVDHDGSLRIARIHDLIMRKATHGLCGFSIEGELLMAVDPARVEAMWDTQQEAAP